MHLRIAPRRHGTGRPRGAYAARAAALVHALRAPHDGDRALVGVHARRQVHRDRQARGGIERIEGALVVGVSGGATLGLELAARGVQIRGAVLHEPAAGSLVPGLLAGVGDALARDGGPGFGAALYGAAWSPAETNADAATVGREFAMFAGFEPAPLAIDPATVLVTTGERSPAPRHAVADAVRRTLGVRTALVPGARS